MAIPIPISMQADRLEKYGINSELAEEFKNIKDKCKRLALEIKQDKLSVGMAKDNLSSDKLILASKGISLNPRDIMRKMAQRKAISAQKKLIKKRQIEIKIKKAEYKKIVQQRKKIRNAIKEEYEANKDKIKDIKEDRRQERREKLEKMGLFIMDTTKGVKDKIMDIKDRIIPKETENTEIKNKETDEGR